MFSNSTSAPVNPPTMQALVSVSPPKLTTSFNDLKNIFLFFSSSEDDDAMCK
jgi:hypothetical protein